VYSLPTTWVYTSLLVYTSLYHPGYTTLPPPLMTDAADPGTRVWQRGEECLGSNLEKEVGMRRRQASFLLRCEERWELCASMLCSLMTDRMKDWIDEGSLPIYPHWLGYVAQGGHPFMRHPIVAECGKESAPGHHPFHCWLMFLPFPGPYAGVSDSVEHC